MDYSKIMGELKDAPLFSLFRLNSAIWRELENPTRIKAIKKSLKVDQQISYFDADENRLVDATIIKLKRTKALVKNSHDGRHWNIPFYHINIDELDTNIYADSKQSVDRNTLRVGDKVCFQDKDGNDLFGEITKLNPKTAKILVGDIKWRVAYTYLSPVIDGSLGSGLLLEGEVVVIE
jgi:hypothetical protein